MKRILLRAPKDPLEPISAERTLRRNLIGTNSGNLLFIDALHRLLSIDDVEIRPDRFKTNPRRAERINERYDAYVIPLANAFRLGFEPKLARMAELIERLRIPVVVVGVGAQTGMDNELGRLKPIEATVKRFVAAVLDHSPSIGVRGELTHDYLRGLGFSDVEVIGCPSMFLHGPALRVEKRSRNLGRHSRIAVNVSPHVPHMGPMIERLADRYPRLRYIAQDLETLGLLLHPEEATAGDPELPLPASSALMRRNRTRIYVDPWPWMRDLAGFDFAFGTRIHGNIAALLAGTPAFVLAHDSRTLELARYFAIPHRSLADVSDRLDPADLYAEASFAELNRRQPVNFAAFAAYLARNDLETIYAEGRSGREFDALLARVRFPHAVDAHRIAVSEGLLRDAFNPDSPLRRRTGARLRRWRRRLLRRPGVTRPARRRVARRGQRASS